MKPLFFCAVALLTTPLFTASAYAEGNTKEEKTDIFAQYFPSASEYVTPLMNVRYRYKFVDQDGKKDAHSSTLRTRVGFETKEYKGFKFLIEGENVGIIGAEQFYSGVNGKNKYAKVEDPDVTELNRLQVSFNHIPDTEVTVGRQLLNMGSRRFIASQNWRQNQTTYDAVSVKNTSLKDIELSYAYITKQHNNLGYDAGGNVDTNTHAVDLLYKGIPWFEVTPYVYLIEDRSDASRSNWTAGIYTKGKNKIEDDVYFLHKLEYAHQGDYDNNPNSFSLHYYNIRAGLKWKNFTVTAGYNEAEGDGTTGLITHFANNHIFHGWEDKFSVIPADGMQDRYFLLSYKPDFAKGWKFIAQRHEFDAERTGASYGSEWDFMISKRLSDRVTAKWYYESYEADTFSKNTEKTTFQITFKL